MLNWLSYYDWILGPEGPDPKPDEETLENDDRLDAFIDKWKKDLKKGASNKGAKSFEIDQSG